MASSSPVRGAHPAASRAVACTGLFAERGSTGRATSPTACSTPPSGPTTTSEPRCTDSRKPERHTSTSTGVSGQRKDPVLLTPRKLGPSLGTGPSTSFVGEQRGDVGLAVAVPAAELGGQPVQDRKSTRLNSSHANISYAVFCL